MCKYVTHYEGLIVDYHKFWDIGLLFSSKIKYSLIYVWWCVFKSSMHCTFIKSNNSISAFSTFLSEIYQTHIGKTAESISFKSCLLMSENSYLLENLYILVFSIASEEELIFNALKTVDTI